MKYKCPKSVVFDNYDDEQVPMYYPILKQEPPTAIEIMQQRLKCFEEREAKVQAVVKVFLKIKAISVSREELEKIYSDSNPYDYCPACFEKIEHSKDIDWNNSIEYIDHTHNCAYLIAKELQDVK